MIKKAILIVVGLFVLSCLVVAYSREQAEFEKTVQQKFPLGQRFRLDGEYEAYFQNSKPVSVDAFGSDSTSTFIGTLIVVKPAGAQYLGYVPPTGINICPYIINWQYNNGTGASWVLCPKPKDALSWRNDFFVEGVVVVDK